MISCKITNVHCDQMLLRFISWLDLFNLDYAKNCLYFNICVELEFVVNIVKKKRKTTKNKNWSQVKGSDFTVFHLYLRWLIDP